MECLNSSERASEANSTYKFSRSLFVCLFDLDNGDCLTLVLGGRQAGVFAGCLFLEDSWSFDGSV